MISKISHLQVLRLFTLYCSHECSQDLNTVRWVIGGAIWQATRRRWAVVVPSWAITWWSGSLRVLGISTWSTAAITLGCWRVVWSSAWRARIGIAWVVGRSSLVCWRVRVRVLLISTAWGSGWGSVAHRVVTWSLLCHAKAMNEDK